MTESNENPKAIEPLEIRAVGDESLVHDPTNGKVHVLNMTAAKILQLCNGSRSADDIVKSISEEMGADPAIVSQDVDSMIAQFKDIGLVLR